MRTRGPQPNPAGTVSLSVRIPAALNRAVRQFLLETDAGTRTGWIQDALEQHLARVRGGREEG